MIIPRIDNIEHNQKYSLLFSQRKSLKFDKSEYMYMIFMGRITTLLTIWIVGFVVGFVGWLMYPQISSLLMGFAPIVLSIFDAQITNAALAGFTTSIISVLIVLVWANKTRNNRF